MSANALPALARALGSAALAHLDLDDNHDAAARVFIPAVVALDEADRAYRAAVAGVLPKDAAATTLAVMAQFRHDVSDVRQTARREIEALFAKAGRSYGAFDPLDAYLPSTAGLSHADGSRAATIADGARARTAALRADANAAATRRLDAPAIEALIAAKRVRRDAFTSALRAALTTLAAGRPGIDAYALDKAQHALVPLADGWY